MPENILSQHSTSQNDTEPETGSSPSHRPKRVGSAWGINYGAPDLGGTPSPVRISSVRADTSTHSAVELDQTTVIDKNLLPSTHSAVELDLNSIPSWTSPPKAALESSINVPIGRGEKLRQDIQISRTELKETQKKILLLDEKIARFGGRLYAPPPDVMESDNTKEKEKNLEQYIDALDIFI